MRKSLIFGLSMIFLLTGCSASIEPSDKKDPKKTEIVVMEDFSIGEDINITNKFYVFITKITEEELSINANSIEITYPMVLNKKFKLPQNSTLKNRYIEINEYNIEKQTVSISVYR